MVNPFTISKEAAAVQLIKEIVTNSHGGDDEVLLQDMIEGETSFKEVMTKLLAETREAEAMAEAQGVRVKELQERKARYARKAEHLRAVMHQAMDAAGLTKLDLPEAKLSIGATQPAVVIFDETALPESCVRVKREPNKTEIRKMLSEGQSVPGAALSNGGETLTVRAK